MKRALKWVARIAAILLIIILIGVGVIYFGVHKERPEGRNPEKADRLARKMLDAIRYEAWDSTAYVGWTFNGDRHFLWDKRKNRLEVRWDGKRVLLKTKEGPKGVAFQKGKELDSTETRSLINKGWSMFCNDSFWLIAPAKVFDPGTERRIVNSDSHKDRLLVTYKKGGVTPGDSYLWEFNDQGLPQGFRMWVSIIPVGGLSATWEDWETLSTGAKIATTHRFLSMKVKVTDLRGGMEQKEVTDREKVFAPLRNASPLLKVSKKPE